MTENVIKNIQELNDKRTKKEILSECLKEIEWNKNSLWQYVIAAVAAFVVSCCATFLSDTVEMTKTISATFLDVQLAFFAVIFGAYAISQALMRDEIIRELIRTENNILKDNIVISQNKKGQYFFKLLNGSKQLLCTGETYPSKAGCESAVDSVKRFAESAVIVLQKTDEDKE